MKKGLSENNKINKKYKNLILIIAHYPLASALKKSAIHVFKNQTELIKIIDIKVDNDLEIILKQGKELINKYKKTLVFTDIYGATPSNIASKLINNNSYLISGVNLAMILRAINYQHEDLINWAKYSIDGGKKSILLFDKKIKTNVKTRNNYSK